MARTSIREIPSCETTCPKRSCVYNQNGVCGEPRINKGNSDAECHTMLNKDLLALLRGAVR